MSDASSGDTDTSKWMELAEPSQVAAALVGLYERKGNDRYDEVVTQAQHARQCGALAMAAGASEATIVAAFLHDVGHLLGGRTPGSARPEADLHHEDTGSRFLANWFGDDVTEPIRLHVAAKRYLCAVVPSYFDGLSPASVNSLRLQGGPMTRDEVAEFDSSPMAATAAELRRWDDLAKDPGAYSPDLDVFRGLIEDVLCRRS